MKKTILPILMALILSCTGCAQMTEISSKDIVINKKQVSLHDEKTEIDKILNANIIDCGADVYLYKKDDNNICGIRYNEHRREGEYIATWIKLEDDSFKTYGNTSVNDKWSATYEKIAVLDNSATQESDGIRIFDEYDGVITYRIAFQNNERIPEYMLDDFATYGNDNWVIIDYEVLNDTIISITIDDGALF